MKSRPRLEQLQQEMRGRAGQPARGPGRPRLPIDPVTIAVLAGLGHSNKDIAARVPCDRNTLRRFAAELARARAGRQALSQLHEFAAAQQGDTQALRRLLRQADKRAGRAGSVSAGTKKKMSRAGGAAGGEK